jgi:hypothetical protein
MKKHPLFTCVISLLAFVIPSFGVLAGSWSTTGSLTTPRFVHTATLLQDGRVLVTGGAITEVPASPEIHNLFSECRAAGEMARLHALRRCCLTAAGYWSPVTRVFRRWTPLAQSKQGPGPHRKAAPTTQDHTATFFK